MVMLKVPFSQNSIVASLFLTCQFPSLTVVLTTTTKVLATVYLQLGKKFTGNIVLFKINNISTKLSFSATFFLETVTMPLK